MNRQTSPSTSTANVYCTPSFLTLRIWPSLNCRPNSTSTISSTTEFFQQVQWAERVLSVALVITVRSLIYKSSSGMKAAGTRRSSI